MCLIFIVKMVQKWQTKLRLNKLMQAILWGHCTAQKWIFALRISFVNVTKSAVSCGFGHIYWRDPPWKTPFFVQCWFNPIQRKAMAFKKILVEVLLELINQKYQNHLRKFHKQCCTPSDIVNRLQLLIVNSASLSTV